MIAVLLLLVFSALALAALVVDEIARTRDERRRREPRPDERSPA